MTKFLTKIKSWFKKPIKRQKPLATQAKNPTANYQPINHQHYRKLIGKIAKQAIAVQRARQRRNHE